MLPQSLEEKNQHLELENARLKARLAQIETENPIYQSERWWQNIIDSIPNPLFIKDRNHNYVLVNKAFEFFVGYERDVLIGKSDHDFFIKEQADIFFAMDAQVLENGRTNWNEEKITVKGQEFELLTSKVRIEDKENNRYVLGVLTDISDNKNQQVLLQKKNAEIQEQKENIQILLKEVHHRVKNNLQIVSSLLNLQMGQLSDEQSRYAFLNCKNRILAMGRVHDLLINSASNANVNFEAYLSTLVANIQNAFKSEQNVVFDINVPRFSFDLDTIIPLGLLINEIITNSVKHGVKAGGALQISVDLTVEKGRASLRVADDGTGITSRVKSFGKASLGMELIDLFCDQLSARCEMIADRNGVVYEIDFDVKNQNYGS